MHNDFQITKWSKEWTLLHSFVYFGCSTWKPNLELTLIWESYLENYSRVQIWVQTWWTLKIFGSVFVLIKSFSILHLVETKELNRDWGWKIDLHKNTIYDKILDPFDWSLKHCKIPFYAFLCTSTNIRLCRFGSKK